MEHEVLFLNIAAAELKVRCNLEVEALGELFIQCSCVIGTLFCVPTHPRLSPSHYVQQVILLIAKIYFLPKGPTTNQH